jgi:diguanylate cyclase (GGDEF)-like protein
MARGARAVVAPETVVAELSANSSLNLGSALLFLVTALVFHLTLVALVGARLMSELGRLSRHDGLTELLNRRAMDDLLRDEARRAVRTNQPFALLMVDADYFKAINDRFGHAAGDEALRYLAQILNALMRDSDRVGRFGGEEFIVLLPNTSSTEALNAAERLRDALLRRPWAWQGESLRLTVSTGVAAWRGPHDEVDLLLKRADAAMYRAKSLGRDRFEFDQ